MTVPNTTVVTVPDRLSNGGIWSQTNSSAIGELTFGELIDFIEPQPERTCVPVAGFPVCADDQKHGTPVKLKARAGAIMQSAEDWGGLKTALEQACRELGRRCGYEVKQAIARSGAIDPRAP